ncbi:hypothetical protein HD806DRAFT_474932 [Xylariaceae sp. AK1471]|nr:hypothetical protein HD806DRAFT_474932 [Xylariaceae sp. AK1471]
MLGANGKRKAGDAEGNVAHRPENHPVKIKTESPNDVIIIDDDNTEYSKTRPKRKRPMLRTHREKAKLHESTVKNRSFDDSSSILKIQENLRDQVAQWSERTQQLESAHASLEKDVTNLKEGTSQLQPQDQDEKYESLIRRIEELENTCSDQVAPTAVETHAPEAGLLSIQSTTDERKGCISSVEARRSTPPTQVSGTLSLRKQDYVATPILTNEGLGKLLRNINFSDLSHLRMLRELDSRKVSRDAPLFCDHVSFPLFEIDYVIRGGPTAAYIADHPSCYVSPNSDVNLDKFKLHDLEGLRVLKLTYHVKMGDRTIKEEQEAKRSITTWKKTVHPPRYIYDLGQLFLHRKGGKEGNRFELVPTKYNIVVDIISPNKPVWLVMRPEFEPHINRNHGRSGRRDSECPFQDRHGYDLECCVTAQLAKKIEDLKISGGSFAHGSYPAFYQASEVVVDTSCDEAVRLQFSIPDLEEMLQIIGKWWSIGLGYGYSNDVGVGVGGDDDEDSI